MAAAGKGAAAGGAGDRVSEHRIARGYLVPRRGTGEPTGRVGRAVQLFKHAILGSPIATAHESQERLSWAEGKDQPGGKADHERPGREGEQSSNGSLARREIQGRTDRRGVDRIRQADPGDEHGESEHWGELAKDAPTRPGCGRPARALQSGVMASV